MSASPASRNNANSSGTTKLNDCPRPLGDLAFRPSVFKENFMQFRKFLVIAATLLSFLAPGAMAQDKSGKQAEVKAKAAEALQDFYKADPKLKDAVTKGAGYAVF